MHGPSEKENTKNAFSDNRFLLLSEQTRDDVVDSVAETREDHQ
jgi:hypothetical protein